MKSPLINVFLFFATILISGAFDSSEGMNAGHIIEEKSTLEVDHSSFRVQTTCTTPYGSGTCIDTASCGGFSVSGYCSGAANIQCCITAACNPPAGSGTCKENTKTCSGTYYSGYCPGPSNVQCCVASTGGGGTACTTPYGSGVCESTSACTGSAVPGYCSGDSSIQCCVPKISITAAQKGIDISVALSASTATCWAPSIAYIIVRGYQSLGQVDPAMCGSLTSATNAGIKNRDVYIFPCPTCSKSAATQMNELVTYINGHCKAQFSGRVWLDIEGTQYWLGNSASNQVWYKTLVDACKSSGYSCGVYSSLSQWGAIFGTSSFSYGSDLPLWYAHYDNQPSFGDFSAFGGWTKPYAKQYGGVDSCGINTDLNYCPNWSG